LRYKQSTKLLRLKERYNWAGDIAEFSEFVTQLIKQMPNEPQPIGEVMERYYLKDESAQKTADGKYVGNDKFFYTNLQIGRAALDTIMSLPSDMLNTITISKRKGMW
jgi:hypothetical protein